MPKKSEIIPMQGYNAATLRALCYGSLLQLKWPVQLAGEKAVLATTKARLGEDIVTEVADNQVTVTSGLHQSASLDLFGKNKKNITRFKEALHSCMQTAGHEQLLQWQTALAGEEEQTQRTLQEQQRLHEELNQAMNLSGGKPVVTYIIMGLNVLVFIAMVATGTHFFEPSGMEHLRWGSNFAPLTFTGDWWRILSCTFLHFGIIHLALNMYALYSVGIFLEPMLGKTRYTIAYLCCGALASIASLWWHSTPANSAGASGAVFGMYGLFIALLTTNLIPQAAKAGFLQSMGIFVVYNLVYGSGKKGIDNSAHIGGLVAGLAIGYLFYLSIKRPKPLVSKTVVMGIAAAATIGICVFYLQSVKDKYSQSDRQNILQEINQAGYKNDEDYSTQMELFDALQVKAVNSDSFATVSLPAWEKADSLLRVVKNYDIHPDKKQRIETLIRYVDLRKEEGRLLSSQSTQNSEALQKEIKTVQTNIETLLNDLNKK
jgi:rhomboid protease GluP